MTRRGAIGALGAVVIGLGLLASRLPPPVAIPCDGCPARARVALDLLSGPQATDPRRDRIPAGALVERADGTLNGYAVVRYRGQVGWVASSGLRPLPSRAPVPSQTRASSLIDGLAERPPLWLSGLLAALSLGRRRRTVVARSDQPREGRGRTREPTAESADLAPDAMTERMDESARNQYLKPS